MSAINGDHLKFQFFILLTITIDAVFFGSALSPLSVNMVLFTTTGARSPIIVNVYTNGSV